MIKAYVLFTLFIDFDILQFRGRKSTVLRMKLWNSELLVFGMGMPKTDYLAKM